MKNENNRPDFKIIEEKSYNRMLDYLNLKLREIIEEATLTVLAGYYWARNRNFDPVFNQAAYDDDRRRAEKRLRDIYGAEVEKPLQQLIQEMIKKQAEVIWWRRVTDGKDPGFNPDLYAQDGWEAKRYVAYLFFEGIRKSCFEEGICPDFAINAIGKEIIDLIKSLTIEEYCRIKGYLFFLRERDKYGEGAYGFDEGNYLSAMNDLDKTFLNCNHRTTKRMCDDFVKLMDDEEKIKKAKYSPRDRIGHIDQEAIKEFVDRYYSFIRKVVSNDIDHQEAEKVLVDLYHKSNSKIINMMEFLLKCMIASYVDEKVHFKIRLDSGKMEISKVGKVIHKGEQKEPIFR